MGCSCNAKKGGASQQKYVVTVDGKSTTYASKTEADRAKLRAGSGATIRLA